MIQNDATFNEQQFYVVDAKTGENRGSVTIDTYDDITDEEYAQIAEDAENERIHSLIEASAEINELRGDCKKMLERLMLTTAALGIALRDYRGPYRKELQQRRDEAEDMFAHMFQYYGEDIKNGV